MTERATDAIADVAVLAEPVRRSLYEHVVGQPEPVGRDAAAAAVGIGRPLAAFHLDRLVEAGLLDVSYRRLTGRTGPGAGRPAKLYQRSDRQLELTLPPRRYEVAARLFAHALSAGSAGSASTTESLDEAARALGRSLGDEARRRAGPRAGRDGLLEAAVEVLTEAGFEPAHADGAVIVLRNCPFDALARTYTELVCGMNLSMMDGVIAGLHTSGIAAELDPQPGMCCVVWRRA